MAALLERIFRLKEANTNVRTEVAAGFATFATMAYILAVNPSILSETGMDKDAVFTATALASAVAIFVMGFFANLPFALAPGMGLNAFFAYTVVIGMGYTWQFALTAVLLEGFIFILLTIFNIRDLILKAIPSTMKQSISAGIGLFIALIGLSGAGIVVSGEAGATIVKLGDMGAPAVWVTAAGIIITGILLALRIKSAILIGIIAATILAIPLQVSNLPQGFQIISSPPSVEPIFMQFEFENILSIDMLIILFTFLFVDMFDTIGTLVGVATKADMMDEEGNLPRAKSAFMADAIGTTIGACLGTSTVTTYVESASGVAAGGRTGLTAITVGLLFLASLFIAPVFSIIPAAATAPALIIVGLFMLSPIAKIKWDDYTESIPSFLTIVIMPFTYSISDGIAFGLVSYVLIKAATGRHKELSIPMVVLSIVFVFKFFI